MTLLRLWGVGGDIGEKSALRKAPWKKCELFFNSDFFSYEGA